MPYCPWTRHGTTHGVCFHFWCACVFDWLICSLLFHIFFGIVKWQWVIFSNISIDKFPAFFTNSDTIAIRVCVSFCVSMPLELNSEAINGNFDDNCEQTDSFCITHSIHKIYICKSQIIVFSLSSPAAIKSSDNFFFLCLLECFHSVLVQLHF